MMPGARCSLHGANSYARPGTQNLSIRLLGHGIVPTAAHSLPRGVNAFLLGFKTMYVGHRVGKSVYPSRVGSYPTRRAGVLHVGGCDAWK